jgi:predicted RNase H-like nuclease (RuvC/YqgF family)
MPLADIQALIRTHAPDKPDLLKEVEQVFDQAGALQKVKDANADLTRQREDLEKQVREAKAALPALETQKKDLEARLAEVQKGIKPDEAVVNGFKEEISKLTKRLNDADAEKATALQKQQSTELQNSVISAAGKAINPKQVFALMQTEGLVGIKDGSAFFHKLNEQGQPVALKPEEAVESFLKQNPHLEKASGTAGSGGNPNPATANPKSGLLDKPEAAL